MFEVGFTEIILIFGIALLVLGPKKLPKLAADVGRWAGRARSMARQLRTQLEQEVQYDPLQEVRKPAPAIYSSTPSPNVQVPPPAPAADDATVNHIPEPQAAPADAPRDEPKPE